MPTDDDNPKIISCGCPAGTNHEWACLWHPRFQQNGYGFQPSEYDAIYFQTPAPPHITYVSKDEIAELKDAAIDALRAVSRVLKEFDGRLEYVDSDRWTCYGCSVNLAWLR